MSVIRYILPVSRNLIFFLCQYFWPIETASLFGMKMFCSLLGGVGGRWGLGRWTVLYKMGGFASNCREDNNIFLYSRRKMSMSAGCFLKAGPIPGSCKVEFV